MKTIKITKVPGMTQELAVEDTATIGEVLSIYRDATGQETTGYEIRMNDEVVSEDAAVQDNAKVYLVKQIKGNK